MILVAGGTGRLGTVLVRDLVGRGERVRVLTRQPGRAAHLLAPGLEVVAGDVCAPRTLVPAAEGVDVVVSALHGFAGPGRVSPGRVDRDGNRHLVRAAAAAGADVVLLSVVDAAADAPMSLSRAKHTAEQYLRASSVPWTVVRCTAFLETWADVLAGPVVPGRGANPITFVAVADVAATVRDAVLDATLRGRVIEVCGPDDLTLDDLAGAVRRRRPRGPEPRHVPLIVLRLAAPFSRRAAAAVVMDTADMVIDRSRPTVVVGATSAATALDALLGPPAR